jgi:hypothetical protein
LISQGAPLQKFDYRYPRFSVDLPARLITQDSTRIGRCVDIGKEGLKLELDQSLLPDDCGTLSLFCRGHIFELRVRVAHAGASQGRMEFIYSCDSERAVVQDLLASLAKPSER